MDFQHDILPLKNIIFRTALRIVLNKEEAEDIVQDTLLKLWERRKELGGVMNLEAFALTVARNLALDRKEKMENRNVSFDEVAHDCSDEGRSGIEHRLVQQETQGFIAGMIDELGERIVVEGVGRDIRTRLYPRPYKHIVMCLCLCRHWH